MGFFQPAFELRSCEFPLDAGLLGEQASPPVEVCRCCPPSRGRGGCLGEGGDLSILNTQI